MRKMQNNLGPTTATTCPPGYHTVRGHKRTYSSGITIWIADHLCKNSGNQVSSLLAENLHYLFLNNKKSYPKLKSNYGFGPHHEVDQAIQFWLEYWKNQGHEFEIDPLLIKCMIAKESGFDPKAKSKNSTATGLMQILNPTRIVLAGGERKGFIEIKKDSLRLSRDELMDPNLNIAAGTRWLIHKFERLKKSERNEWNALKAYHSQDKKGEAYANSIFQFYKNFDNFLVLSILFFISLSAYSDPDLDKVSIRLNDGRVVEAVRKDDFIFEVQLKKMNKVLYKLTLGSEHEYRWNYCFFIPIRGHGFFSDLNGDNDPEIAIASYEGGNNPFREIEIYSIREKSMTHFSTVYDHNIMNQNPIFK